MEKLTPTQEKYLGITIDYSRDALLSEQGMVYLTGDGFYKKEHETSPQQTFARTATCYSFGDLDFAQRIYDYVSRGWFMFASPVMSNAQDVKWPKFEKTEFAKAAAWLKKNVKPDGMPISCFKSFIPDTKEGLVEARKEAAWLSMMGGGVGLFAANRSPDSKSTGVMAHLKGYDADTLSYKQTASRRGSMAVYLNDNHPEIKSFIAMRQPAGGNPNQKCFNLNNGVTITDKFMTAVINNEEYELVDPKHGPTGNFVNAREIWEEILKVRAETGEPYLNFIDTVNRNKPKWITKPTYHVSQSNLCLVGDTTIRVKEHKDAEPETMRLDDFVEKFELGYLTNPLVESHKDGGVIWGEVSAAAQTAVVDELYEIETPKGRIIRCTGNHKIYTKNRGYVEAQFLEETDELLEL